MGPSRSRLHAFIFVCLLLAAGFARAAPCLTGAVDALVGTSCDIGDKTFSFTGTLGMTNLFIFTPDASDPLSPAFTITPAAGAFAVTQANTRRFFALDFDLATMSGDPTLAGLDVTVTGNVSGGTPTDTAGGGTIVDAGNESNLGLFVEACIQSGGGFSACLMDATTASAAGSFPSPVSSESGTASWLIATDATGSATFLSARYSFDQVVLQVPEPHALLLWGIALAGLAFSIRKRIAA